MPRYMLIDAKSGERKQIGAVNAREARMAAHTWAELHEWHNTETVWSTVHLVDLDAPVPDDFDEDAFRAQTAETLTIVHHPFIPDCFEDNHDWQTPHSIVGGPQENPGVWDAGDHFVVHRVCMNCGCLEVTTWLKNQAQGSPHSLSYQRERYKREVVELWAETT